MSEYFNERMGQLLDMRRNGIPEHIKKLKIKSTIHHDYVTPLKISVELHNGKKFMVETSGHDSVGDIINKIVERC